MANVDVTSNNSSPKATILMVEDSPSNVLAFQDVLETAEYHVLVTNNGAKGLQIALDTLPHLILLDVILPGLDGFEICRRLKANASTKDIPIIFMTGVSDIENKIQAFNLGAVDYVTKPVQADEVLARINTHLTLRQLQQGLHEELRMREELIAELDAFAHTVAHDLKSPLSAVLGFAEILQKQIGNLTPEKIAKVVDGLIGGGQRINSIIDALLLLASARQEGVPRQSLNMKYVVDEVQDRLAYTLENGGVELIAPETWPTVFGYGPWIEEVWANYISNAIKYGGKPPQVELGASIQRDGFVRFWVCDNGEGLTEDEQQKLFVPFTRLNKVKAKGHGLGLSIVQRIVKRLGGTVGVESEVGRGSTFFFTLPQFADNDS